MPRNATITLEPGSWTQITDAAVSALRVQSLTGHAVKLMATAGSTAPADDAGHIELNSREIVAANYTLDELWPGVEGANRVWAWCAHGARLSVSHA